MRSIPVTAVLSFLLLGATTVLADGTNGNCTYDCEYEHPGKPETTCTGDEQGIDVEKCMCKYLMEEQAFMDCAAKCAEDDRQYFADGFSPWCSEHMFDNVKDSGDSDDAEPTATSSDSTATSTETAAAESSTGAAAAAYGKPGLAIAGGLLAFLFA